MTMMTPQQEIVQFERKSGRRFTRAQREEVLRSIGIGGLALGIATAQVSSVAPVPTNWSTVFPSTLFAIQSDLGVTSSTTFTMADQSGHGKDFTATTTARPSVATGPNGYSEIIFDGATNIITCSSLNLPAPGTTPFFLFMGIRYVSFTSGNPVVCGDPVTNTHLLYVTATPNKLASFDGNADVTITAGYPAVNAYECLELYRANSTSADYLRRASVTSSGGVSSGNGSTTSGFCIGGGGTLNKCNMGLLFAVGCSALPTGPQIAAARAKVTAMYGASVLV